MIRATGAGARGKFVLESSIRSYCTHLPEQASGRKAGDAQAHAIETKEAIRRRPLLDSEAVQFEWIGVARTIRAGVLRIPRRAGARLGLTAEQLRGLESECREVCSGARAMADNLFCNNCGYPITGEPPVPCRCGSVARRVDLHLQASAFAVAGAVVIPYEEALMSKAQELIAKGDFSIAVVVAHMACEISAERAVLRAFAEKGIEYLDENFANFNLANNRLCNLYNAVTGSQIHNQPFWGLFKKSAKRRNDAVHAGKFITKAEAEASYKAATDLIAYLKRQGASGDG